MRNAVLIDLDSPKAARRPTPFTLVVLALAIGGLSGYAVGHEHAPSARDSAPPETRVVPATSDIDARIATCNSPSIWLQHPQYCSGTGNWSGGGGQSPANDVLTGSPVDP